MKALKAISTVILIIVCGWFGLRYFAFGRFTLPTVKDYEKIARSGLPIVQAISDYRNDQGLLPEKLQDLVPKYLPKVEKTGWLWDGGTLMHHAGMPHSYVIYWFIGGGANQWWLRGDSQAENYQLNVPGPTTNKPVLSGGTLFEAKLAGYERRIQRHPEDQDSYGAKICFLGLEKRQEKLREECDRASGLFPSWWLPQMAMAELNMKDQEAEKKFAEWVQQHETFVNYWYLARYYRDKNDTGKACEALEHSATSSFASYPKDACWVGAGFAYDAAKFCYENRRYDLTIKLCQHCEQPEGSWEAESTLALQAAAELGVGHIESALAHAKRMLSISKNQASWAQNLPALVQAAEARDTNYVYQAGDPAGDDWVLFREPQP